MICETNMEIKIKKVDLPEKKIVQVSKSPKILVYFDGKNYYPFGGICPHAKWPLELGNVSENTLTCAGHGWEFDVTNGKCKSNPGRDLHTFQVIERFDEISIIT